MNPRSAQPRQLEAFRANRPPITAPNKKASSATAEREIESPGIPANANPRSTTLPVMLAAKTWPMAIKLIASTIPVTTVIAIRVPIGALLTTGSLMTVASEFVSRPKLCVVDVPARRRLFQEFAGEEDSIIGLQIGMTIDLPSRLDARPVSDKSRPAVARWHEQKPGTA